MKKPNFLRKALYVAGLLLLSKSSIAQPYAFVPPSTPDNYWYSCLDPNCIPGGYISGLNTAMIDYVNGPGYGQFLASIYCGNGTAGGLFFEDYVSGCTFSMPYMCANPNYMGDNVDIAMANDPSNPLGAFICAACYQNMMTGNGQVDFYEIKFLGGAPPGCFNVSLIASTIVKGTNLHIDAISQKTNTGATGLPYVSDVVLSWQNGADILVQDFDLTVPIPAVATGIIILQALNGDVAGIQRMVGATLDNLALVTYTDYSGTILFESDFDLSTLTMISTTVLANYPAPSSGISLPRIDAMDAWTVNTPSATLAYFRVTYDYMGNDFLVDNTNAMSPVNDVAYMIPGSICGYYSPSIAFGGDLYNHYMTIHYRDELPCAAGVNPGVIMEPTRKNGVLTPATVPATYVCGVASRNYYGVNSTPISAIGTISGNYDVAISTPCNNVDDMTLTAWSVFNTATNVSDVYFKVAPYINCAGGGPGYLFREAGNTQASNTTVENKLIMFPNPAENSISVDAAGADEYQITDMPGRTILQGNLTTGSQNIDISGLTTGSYIIVSYKNGQRVNHASFVKI